MMLNEIIVLLFGLIIAITIILMLKRIFFGRKTKLSIDKKVNSRDLFEPLENEPEIESDEERFSEEKTSLEEDNQNSFSEDNKYYNTLNTIEPKLHDNEKAVSLDMENQLQNSINLALKSLENQEIIPPDKSFYLYLGSFENQENAKKRLSAAKKIDDMDLVTNFSIKKNITDDVRNSFSVISNNFFFHEKALDYCKVVLKHNLDCKIISDI